MADLATAIGNAYSQPKPDRPPSAGAVRSGHRGPIKPTKFATRKVNGKWVLVPVEFGPGREDPRLRPRVTVTPLNP